MRRRAMLAAGGALLVGLAGCATDRGGSSDDVDGDGTATGGPATDGDPTAGPDTGTATPATTAQGDESLATAPIARDLADQPRLGPDPTDAESVIVEVTDPSCPTCRAFHEQAFPEIQSELVDPGTTAFVVRNVDWVYAWAPTAAATLEAVHDRAPAAYWGLLSFYFASQGEMSPENVRSRTETYLQDTAVDAGAVVAAVDAGEYDAAVAADVRAARDAGASGQPYFFLFRDGTLRTSFRGAQSYDVFRRSLGY